MQSYSKIWSEVVITKPIGEDAATVLSNNMFMIHDNGTRIVEFQEQDILTCYAFFAILCVQSALGLVLENAWETQAMDADLAIHDDAANMTGESLDAVKPNEHGLSNGDTLIRAHFNQKVKEPWKRVQQRLGPPNHGNEELSSEAVKAFGKTLDMAQMTRQGHETRELRVNAVYSAFLGDIETNTPTRNVFKFFNHCTATFKKKMILIVSRSLPL